jgi:uncharacterized integral membrane protein
LKILGIAILVALALLALFAALNWGALTAPTALSFVFFTVEGPLGVILLGVALAFALVLLAYAAMQRTAMLVESRRHAHELRAQRDLAEQAEASRLHELRQQLERECAQLRATIEEATNSLAAGIGQIDEKLSRPGTLIAAPRDGQS